MTPLRWLVMLDPIRVQCVHCGSRLKATPRWRKRYYLVSAVALLIVVAPSLLAYFAIIPFEYLILLSFVAVGMTLLLLFSLAAFFWRRFEYQQEVHQS